MATYRFRLVEGQHVQADKSKPILGPDGKPTGRFERVTFVKGQVFESDTNLVAKFGRSKFEQLSGPTENAAAPVASFPGGQVSSGKQVTTIGPDGKQVSGPVTEPTEVETEEPKPLFAEQPRGQRTMHAPKK